MKKAHTIATFGVARARSLLLECVFREGGKTSDAHAPMGASIRAVHATLSLSFVTHTRARVSETRKRLAFAMLVKARFDA